MRNLPNAYAQTEMMGLESHFRQRAYDLGRLKQFHIVARSIASQTNFAMTIKDLERESIGRNGDLLTFVKSAQAAQTFDEVWATAAGRSLSQAFLTSIAPASLLEQILRFGFSIPDQVGRVLTASGAVADVAEEGTPKVVKHRLCL